MSLIQTLHGGVVTAAVHLPANAFVSTGGTLPIYSGLKIDADGGLYERAPAGGFNRFATWLLKGTASTYYVQRTIIDGSLTTDPGTGWLQLNTDRIYDIQTSAAEETA